MSEISYFKSMYPPLDEKNVKGEVEGCVDIEVKPIDLDEGGEVDRITNDLRCMLETISNVVNENAIALIVDFLEDYRLGNKCDYEKFFVDIFNFSLIDAAISYIFMTVLSPYITKEFVYDFNSNFDLFFEKFDGANKDGEYFEVCSFLKYISDSLVSRYF